MTYPFRAIEKINSNSLIEKNKSNSDYVATNILKLSIEQQTNLILTFREKLDNTNSRIEKPNFGTVLLLDKIDEYTLVLMAALVTLSMLGAGKLSLQKAFKK